VDKRWQLKVRGRARARKVISLNWSAPLGCQPLNGWHTFRDMSRRSREKDRGYGTVVTWAAGTRGDRREGRANGRENRPVPVRGHWFCPYAVAHATSACIRPSRPSRFVGLARAGERAPQLIKPPRNLYRHYTRCFACKNHLRRTPSDCPPRQRQQPRLGRGRFCTARDRCRYNNWVWIRNMYSRWTNAKLISVLYSLYDTINRE